MFLIWLKINSILKNTVHLTIEDIFLDTEKLKNRLKPEIIET